MKCFFCNRDMVPKSGNAGWYCGDLVNYQLHHAGKKYWIWNYNKKIRSINIQKDGFMFYIDLLKNETLLSCKPSPLIENNWKTVATINYALDIKDEAAFDKKIKSLKVFI